MLTQPSVHTCTCARTQMGTSVKTSHVQDVVVPKQKSIQRLRRQRMHMLVYVDECMHTHKSVGTWFYMCCKHRANAQLDRSPISLDVGSILTGYPDLAFAYKHLIFVCLAFWNRKPTRKLSAKAGITCNQINDKV